MAREGDRLSFIGCNYIFQLLCTIIGRAPQALVLLKVGGASRIFGAYYSHALRY